MARKVEEEEAEIAAAAPAEEKKEVVCAWACGAGTDGQLGTGALEDQHLPQPLPYLPLSVSHIACGGAHAIALTCDGKVLTWGRGICGQLGHGKFESCYRPTPVKFLESLIITYVSAGWNHSGFVTDAGRLFVCGDGSFGQLGNGDNQSHGYPLEVVFFSSKHVKQIACGMRHSLALVTGCQHEYLEVIDISSERETSVTQTHLSSSAGSSGDSIYGFGSGRHGQIGKQLSGGQRSVNIPAIIQELNDSKIVSIHANGDHSAALSANGQLYIWGRRFGRNTDNHIPQVVPSSLHISQVALGWNHALIFADGLVYMLGGNRHGLLSKTQKANTVEVTSPPSTTSNESPLALVRVVFPDGLKVVSVAAGAEHSAAVTEEGSIMMWGWGEHGQLGLGDTTDETCPRRVKLNCNESSSSNGPAVYCGSGFTIAVKSTQ